MSNLVKHIKIGDVVYDLCDPNAATQTALNTTDGKITVLNTDVAQIKADIVSIKQDINDISNYNADEPGDDNSSDNG